VTGGVTSGRRFERLSNPEQRRYPSDLDVRDLERSKLSSSFRQAFIKVYRRAPSGRDYERVERNLASAYDRVNGRIRVRPIDRLWVSNEPMPVPTADGAYDAVPARMTSRQRSVIGEYWSLVGKSRQLSDRQLEHELRRFRRETFRVVDPSGRTVRKALITDVEGFRAFATSPEAHQERVISPRLSTADLGGRGR
jgi:hypothetical protein